LDKINGFIFHTCKNKYHALQLNNQSASGSVMLYSLLLEQIAVGFKLANTAELLF